MFTNTHRPFRRHLQSDIILLCVRWYPRYALSYRNLEEMMRERGLTVDHTTIYRWVQSPVGFGDEFLQHNRCYDAFIVDPM
jgi:transposase-like protein